MVVVSREICEVLSHICPETGGFYRVEPNSGGVELYGEEFFRFCPEPIFVFFLHTGTQLQAATYYPLVSMDTSRRIENSTAAGSIYEDHNPLLAKLGQKLGKIVLSGIISNIYEPKFCF